MFSNNSTPSLSDIAAVTGNNDGFGGNNGWWVLIILFAIFGGWGNNGWGNRGGAGSGGVTDGYVLASDFSNIERKIDSVNNGLCDGFYAQNTNLLNGFANTNAAIANGFAGVNNAICTLGYQNAELINNTNTNIMSATNAVNSGITALSNQMQQCCCENKSQIADLKYAMAQQTTEIMQNCNNNYRQLHDELVQSQLAAKDEKIAEQASIIQALNLAASQQAQNNDLIAQLRPSPVPAYTVANPYAGFGYGCCGTNNGCC